MSDDSRLILAIAAFGFIILVMLVLTVIFSSQTRSIQKLRKELEERDREKEKEDAASQASINALGGLVENAGLRNEQQMENLRSSVDSRLAQVQSQTGESLEYMRKSNAEEMARMRLLMDRNLEQIRQTVDEKLQSTLDDRLSKSFAQVRFSLDQVYKGLGEMQGLAQGVGDLKKVLSNVKTRGIVGEVQLGAILSQILSPSQYYENAVVRPGASERVEYAVRMPGEGSFELLLPIDAKFHGDTYSRLMDAYDNANRPLIDECRKSLAAALKKSAKEIHDKYICPPFTTDFAIMFVPFEGLYCEAVNLGILETVQRDYHVVLSGPSTVSALLNSLQMGFKTLAIQQNAGKVWKVLGSVKTEFDKFAEVLESAQQRLYQANSELDKLIGTRTRMIQRTLRDIQETDVELPADIPQLPTEDFE